MSNNSSDDDFLGTSKSKDEEKHVAKPHEEHSDEGQSERSITNLMKHFANKLGLNEIEDVDDNQEQILTSNTIDGIIEHIKSGKCKNIITMVGAGISTSAGIPDFRSPNSGLYDNLQKYNLPDPQAIFDINYFHENPKPFFALAKELYPRNFRPTNSHYFIKLLDKKGLLLRHYTQNIDTLERVSGLDEEKMVEAHGSFYTSHCTGCKKEFPQAWMKEQIYADAVPTCSCGSVVKPDITFFGENLPERFHTLIDEDFPKCDLLIIMGSSLVVQPFASLIDMVPSTCPRLLVNLNKCGQADRVLRILGISSGLDFDGVGKGARDVFWQGTCDEGTELMASKLGWEEELKTLAEEQLVKIIEAEQLDTKVKNLTDA